MNEENENQPSPPETASAAPEQRQHRPRRRYPRRRYQDRGNRNFSDSYNESPNSSPATADSVAGNVGVETLDRQSPEGGESAVENGEQVQREPEFGDGIIEISGKGFGFLRDAKRNFVQTPQDIFVTPEIVRRFGLRDGMWIYGETRRGLVGHRNSCIGNERKLLPIGGYARILERFSYGV